MSSVSSQRATRVSASLVSQRVTPVVCVLTMSTFLLDLIERGLASPSTPQWTTPVLLVDGELSSSVDEVAESLAHARRSGQLIVVIKVSANPLATATWLELGAHAVLADSDTFGAVLDVIERLQRGETVLGVSVREGLLSQLRQARQQGTERDAQFLALTRRETAVLRDLAYGSSPEDVARTSFVSLNTVRTQIRGILAKLDVTSVVGAVVLAYRSGWLDEHDAAGYSNTRQSLRLPE